MDPPLPPPEEGKITEAGGTICTLEVRERDPEAPGVGRVRVASLLLLESMIVPPFNDRDVVDLYDRSEVRSPCWIT